MVRAYKMKGQKRKKKGEKYDREEEDIEQAEAAVSPPSPKKAKTESAALDTEEKLAAAVAPDTEEKLASAAVPGIPIVSVDSGRNKPGVIFILEKASLEIAKVGKTYQLLSSDEHANFLVKNKLNPADYRPDIAFQAIQTILDSRVNKSGRLKALYVRTQQNLLLDIKPHVRMPRTYKRFSGLIVQLLQKLHITAAGKGEKLLRLIKNPVTQYLPVQCRKIGFSHSSEKLVDMHKYVGAAYNELDLVFVVCLNFVATIVIPLLFLNACFTEIVYLGVIDAEVGAMAHGKIEDNYVEDYISVSEYPLSAAYCISIITNAVEQKWKIM